MRREGCSAALVRHRPSTKAALLEIAGVGDKKVRHHGEALRPSRIPAQPHPHGPSQVGLP